MDAASGKFSIKKLTIEQCAGLACLLEVTTPKPGNVHRGADFPNLTLCDFIVSSVAIGPTLGRALELGVGPTVLAAVRATQHFVRTNTNLGTLLLMAPLAAVPKTESLREGIPKVLNALSSADSIAVYEAIRLVNPGGMGSVREMDLRDTPPSDLLAAMGHAADRDLVAKQYVNGFREVLDVAVPLLVDGQKGGWSLTASIIHTHVQLMADYPDSLIARKCGLEIAKESSQLAVRVLKSGLPETSAYQAALAELDFWLRSDGQRRNPGTTADMIAASLFVLLREQLIAWPVC
jgi:triphosphoribosyl-dephospho-CoA synthase